MDSRQMNSNEIEEAAALWIAKRDRSEWSEADEAELDRWLQASTAHTVAFIRLESMWREANRLKALGAGVEPGVVPAPGAWHRSLFFHSRSDDVRVDAGWAESEGEADWAHSLSEAPERSASAKDRDLFSTGHGEVANAAVAPVDSMKNAFLAVAQREKRWRSLARMRALVASVLISTALGVGWYLWPASTVYQTPIGGVEVVELSDGSNVTLNTSSEIRVAMTDTERRIELKQGEAFFDVAKDPSRPFAVMVGGQQVVAVGTKFSVRRMNSSDQAVRVVVTEGRVRVGPAVTTEFSAAEVAAGSVARASGAGVLVEDESPRPVDEYLSWRSGYLVFRETALADAIAEFNRYNTTQLVIEDPAVASIKIGGSFRSTNVDAFVRLLEDGLAVPLRVEHRGEQMVLRAD